MTTIIDADGLLLGRMASMVAKRLLNGEEIAIINAEKAIISGSQKQIMEKYDQKRKRGSTEFGPYYPRRPDQILKRTIRGMLPYRTQRGMDALRQVKVYVGVPGEFSDAEAEILEDAHMDNRLNNPRHTTLGAVSTFLGAKY